MWDILRQGIIDFLNKFIAPPSGGGSLGYWSWEKVIRYSSTNFLISFFMGWLVLCLWISIISSYGNCRWSDRSIYLSGLAVSYLSVVTLHICVDAFSTLA